MLKIYNIKEKKEYLKEVITLTQKEWGKYNSEEEFNWKLNKKIVKVENQLENNNFCILILLEKRSLIGFISIFPNDCEEKTYLSPWYSTMYVKQEYRGQGFSKMLNDAILIEAKKRNFNKIYLKTDLNNYYEKFGAVFMEKLDNGEKLYYIEL